MLQHPLEIEVLRICAGAGTEQIRSAADLVGIDTSTKVKPICSAGVAVEEAAGRYLREASITARSTYIWGAGGVITCLFVKETQVVI